MRIGVDLDNTIVCYEDLFRQVARERGLPEDLITSKRGIRDHLVSLGQNGLWTEMQGEVYGRLMPNASPYPGAEAFFLHCPNELFIISHRTEFAKGGHPYPLHEPAHSWLKKYDCFSRAQVFIETSREKKIQRIIQLKCDLFIDDLPEVLIENDFPKNIRKILFDPHSLHAQSPHYEKVSSWKEITWS